MQQAIQPILRRLYEKPLTHIGLSRYYISLFQLGINRAAGWLIIGALLRKENTSFSQFAQDSKIYVVLQVYRLVITALLLEYGYGFFPRMQIPTFLVELGHKISERTTLRTQISNPWSRALIDTLFKAFVFRGLLQEGMLKELPRLVLRMTGIARGELVDEAVFKVMRVGLSALLFSLAMKPQLSDPLDTNFYMDDLVSFLRGAGLGFLQERVGFFASFISDFNDRV
jgi:hypothetical protein